MKIKYLVAIIFASLSICVGAQNNSLTFDGNDEYVELPDGIANESNFTFEAWVYWNGTSTDADQRIFDFGDLSSQDKYMHLTPCDEAGNIKFFITENESSSVESITTTATFPTGEWHHIAVTIASNGEGIIYLDGINIGSTTLSTIPSTLGVTTTNYLGQSVFNSQQVIEDPLFNGKMDEVRIWSTVRTLSEIRANMYSVLAGNETGLEAYYQMNETEGVSNTQLPCSSQNAQDATLVNMNNNNLQTSAACYGPGNCLSLDGTNDYVAIPHNSAFDITTAITLEAWVKFTDASANRPVITKNGGAFMLYASAPDNTGKAGIYIEGVSSAWCVSVTSVNDGNWHHIAGTYDGSYIRIYVDGVNENSLSGSGSATNSSQEVHIGYDGSAYFNGNIDDVRIWDIVRDSNEIAENMLKQITGNESGLIAYYNFNNNYSETLQDFAGNALDGSLTNMDSQTDWVASEAYNSWLNTSNTSWGEATNWSRNSVPDAGDNVGIYTNDGESQPVGDDNMVCNNLVIATSNTFEIDNTSHRTIHGSVWNIYNTRIKDNTSLTITGSLYMLHHSTIELYPTANLTIEKNLHTIWLGLQGTFTVKSNSTGTGSLIVDGSSTGDVDFQRYLPGTTLAWHMYSAPVNSTSISGSSFDPGTGTDNDFYMWYEPDPGIWVNFKNQDGAGGDPAFPVANGGNDFINGRGYLIAYNAANPVKTIAGDINTDAVQITLHNSAQKGEWTYAEGWNLIGNPFSSAIDWHLVDHDESTSLFQDAYAYAYNQSAGEGAGQYVPIDGSTSPAVVPSQQGFFVLAKQSSDEVEFSFAKNLKYHANNNVYKNKKQQYDIELMLKAEVFYDNTSINVMESTSPNRDFYDALKLFSFNDKAPGLFTLSNDNIKLAVNSLPVINESTTVKLGVKIPESATYTITADINGSSLLSGDVYLEDLEESTITNLSSDSYTFSAFDGEFTDRFILHFNPVGITETVHNPKFIVSINQRTITIINNEQIAGNYSVTSCDGRLITTGQLTKSIKQSINLNNTRAGIYIITINSSTGTNSQKLVLNY